MATKFSREITLAAVGYFPFQLPPSFNTRGFSNSLKKLEKNWLAINPTCAQKESQFEIYSVPRSSHSRRQTAITNPVGQFYLNKRISSNWVRLHRHFRKTRISLSIPEFSSSTGRAITFTPINALSEHKLLSSVGSQYVLVTDIAQFFPSLYTHALPWALDGKKAAKANRKNKKLGLADSLDKDVRFCQHGQTIGLPIGPDSSHILAEIVAVSADLMVRDKLNCWPSGFRFVDDYYFFFEDEAGAVQALAAITGSLQEYELKINISKTRILKAQDIADDTWTNVLGSFIFAVDKTGQRKCLAHFFDLSRELARRSDDENVMKYAVKRVATEIIKRENWDVFQAHLCRCMEIYPNTIQDVAHIFSTYNSYLFPIASYKYQLGRVINGLIQKHVRLDHHFEVAWALWFCLKFQLSVNKENVKLLELFRSSPALIMLLDLDEQRLTGKRVKRTLLRDLLSTDALYNKHWLAAYESGVRDWIGKHHLHISSDLYFKSLEAHKVRFYDNAIDFEPIFTLKTDQPDIGKLFTSDEDVDDYFEFLDIGSDYVDHRRPRYEREEDKVEDKKEDIHTDLSFLDDDLTF